MCDQKPIITRAGWVCPHCRTAYSPDVQMCQCATVSPSLADRLRNGRRPVSPWAPSCTCGPWNSILPPPPCPVHGQAQFVQVTC